MAKFKLSFAKYIPKPQRQRLSVSPQEKFNRLAKRLKNKGKNHQLRKFHFNAIESSKTIIVFNGEGNETIQAENSRNGYIQARLHCLNLYFASDNQNGGFSFTTNANLEFQTLDELRKNQQLVRNNLDHHAFVNCSSCKFQFEDQDEMNLHKCNDDKEKGWTVFEFVKIRRIYA
jgi:hypothetical protein